MNSLTLGELYQLARERGQLYQAAIREIDKRIPREAK